METGPVPSLSRVQDKRRRAGRVALRTASYFLVLGLVWIVASDRVLLMLLPSNIIQLSNYQTLKGTFFIFLMATLLFFVVRHYVRSLQANEEEMQARAEQSAEQYQRLFQRNPSAMIIFDPTTRQILAANDVALLLYGYPRDELLALRTLDLVVAEERPRVLAATPVYAGGSVVRVGPYQVRRRDGRIIFVDAVTHQVDFNGNPARIALVTDVTERLQSERSLSLYRSQLEQRVDERTAELSRANLQLRLEVNERQRIAEELRAATAAAEAANDAKSNFLANTSHEIRTPLTSILGYADLLAERQLEPSDHDRYVDVVRQNAQHLLALIDDLLDLSRAEMGKVRVILGEQSPREVAQQAIELLHPRAAEKEIALILRIDPETPQTIQTDGVRLRQILLNLLSNAIKFTTRGSVTLTLRIAPQQEDEDGPPMLRFEVTDTGIGMAQEHLQSIFEPFYQVEQGNTRRFGGFGLGLAISQQLAHQMGGALSVKSTPGTGSTFSLDLPATQNVRLPARQADDPPQAALAAHVLLAEDTPNIRVLVSEYLSRAGARVKAVTNGAEAVEAIRQSLAAQDAEAEAFDLVVLDLHMPQLDGFGAMKQMKVMGYSGPVVGLTADYMEKTPDQWTREGWDAMAAKPIDRQAFIPLLARMISQHPRQKTQPVA